MLRLVSLISSRYEVASVLTNDFFFFANLLMTGICYEPDGALNGGLCLICVPSYDENIYELTSTYFYIRFSLSKNRKIQLTLLIFFDSYRFKSLSHVMLFNSDICGAPESQSVKIV